MHKLRAYTRTFIARKIENQFPAKIQNNLSASLISLKFELVVHKN